MIDDFSDQKTKAAAWFEALRDDIIAAFEGLEATQDAGPTADFPVGKI